MIPTDKKIIDYERLARYHDKLNDVLITKQEKIFVINRNDSNAVVSPNTYNIWDNNTYPTTITLESPINNDIVNEYVIRFTIPSTVTNYSLIFNSALKWVDDNVPTWEAGRTYEISIIDGYAVFFKYLN